MIFDRFIFANTLNTNALSTGSIGQCAKYVRIALEASGFGKFSHPMSAKRYGPILLDLEFKSTSKTGYTPLLADIVIVNGIVGHIQGHIAGWTGRYWVSDFIQQGLYPGAAYRRAKPNFTLYRFPG